ncbi:Prodigiosin synthesizing transferase PigC [Geodia barretti]|uniref:Prodigiosin synthesizing transferase PigC n=1 Tax=Geodia barretti TaxID=519541 RepID=A0AA35X4B3_GEOBA|nr:Prodigiosin synthesizing transferase PigC [Geodia barretti]
MEGEKEGRREDDVCLLLDQNSPSCPSHLAGGKGHNLWVLGSMEGCTVPDWFCITTDAFSTFIEANNLRHSLMVDPGDLKTGAEAIQDSVISAPFPPSLEEAILAKLATPTFDGRYVAVRSSGTDEDSASHSFAGQFETYLYQRGREAVLRSVRQCWISCFSERVMSHRLEVGMPLSGLKMGVVVQVMVNSEVSGVGFSRHPLLPVSSHSVLVEAVYGLGEGLVSGLLEADRYQVSRKDFKVEKEMAEKSEMMVRGEEGEGGGVRTVDVEEGRVKEPSLSDAAAVEIAKLLISLEEGFGKPQDFEWGMEDGKLYCLQARPIVTLPPSPFFSPTVPGSDAVLWDNSNIVESFAGVTSPLTFSFASLAYKQVYTQTLRAAGVPESTLATYEPYLGNMVGLVRGNLYYNLINWYRCLSCLPVGDTSKYMETMMGVKQSLDPELEAELGRIRDTAPKYGVWTKIKVLYGVVYTVYKIDQLVEQFSQRFNSYYTAAVETDFSSLSLPAQIDYVKHLFEEVLGKWETPIMNDACVMLFFGLLKSLVSKWLTSDSNAYIDTHSSGGGGGGEGGGGLKEWFLSSKAEVLDMLAQEVGRQERGRRERQAESSTSGLRHRKKPEDAPDTEEDSSPSDPLYQAKMNVVQSLQRFLNKYGFRCINEQKLEENSLHDDPGFLVDMISGYVKTNSYSIANMEERETQIRCKAEETANNQLPIHKRFLFNWVLYHARKAVKHRENMRFSRSKLFGIYRELFRAIGNSLVSLGLLTDRQDVFYLTMEELFAFVDGRAVTNNLSELAQVRKREFDSYRKGLPPPERFMTRGAREGSSDPNVLTGTPCCPGVVEGTVRVVTSIQQTEGLDGEILVTARTDPGWVPLYPLCSGLVIERGSLLSHSAVVARELGLPTIVGVTGGLMKRLKTGMRVHIDAGRGKLTILDQQD